MKELSFQEKLKDHFTYREDECFIRAAYYYGLSSVSWPGNYLSAVSDEEISSDLDAIRDLGFTTIILLVSWNDLEPQIGHSSQRSYKKIARITSMARLSGLNVMYRIPYLWSLIGDSPTDRLLFALLDHKNYQKDFLRFLYEFRSEIVELHDNASGIFGSWEDFYLPVKSAFFSDQGLRSELVREEFSRQSFHPPESVVEAGENCEMFYQWLDGRIRELIHRVDNFGYEIRVDDDPCIIDGKLRLHSHGNYYHNYSGGLVLAYWAPYYGAVNQGETITARKANSKLKLMLSNVAVHTPNRVFVNQLNYFDNTQDTSHHASINPAYYQDFFIRAASLLVRKSCSFGIWTTRDYSHNIVKNPSFANGNGFWKMTGEVTSLGKGIQLGHGASIEQFISTTCLSAAGTPFGSIDINFKTGSDMGEVYVSHPCQTEKNEITESLDARLVVDLRNFPSGMILGVRATATNIGDKDLIIHSVSLNGHVQTGGPLDMSGRPSDFYSLIKEFNQLCAVKEKSRRKWHRALFPPRSLWRAFLIAARMLLNTVKMAFR